MAMPISQSATSGAAQPSGDNTPNLAPPNPDPDSQQAAAPIEFDVHIKADPSELESAIAMMKEAGLDDIAEALEKAISPESQDLSKSTADLTNEITAMGNNPHGM